MMMMMTMMMMMMMMNIISHINVTKSFNTIRKYIKKNDSPPEIFFELGHGAVKTASHALLTQCTANTYSINY